MILNRIVKYLPGIMIEHTDFQPLNQSFRKANMPDLPE